MEFFPLWVKKNKTWDEKFPLISSFNFSLGSQSHQPFCAKRKTNTHQVFKDEGKRLVCMDDVMKGDNVGVAESSKKGDWKKEAKTRFG